MFTTLEGILPIEVSDATTLNSGATASLTTTEIDTVQNGVKYDLAIFLIRTGTIAASGEVSVLKVQESDTSGSGFTDAVDAGANPIGATDDDGWYIIIVDCRSKKRYLDLVASTDAAADCAINHVTCLLARGSVAPVADSNFIGVTRG